MTQKLSQNQISELKETQKMKVVQLHEQIPKQLSNPTLTPKPAHQGPKQTKMTQKSSQLQCQNSGSPRKLKFFNYMSRPKNSCRTLPQPQKQPIQIFLIVYLLIQLGPSFLLVPELTSHVYTLYIFCEFFSTFDYNTMGDFFHCSTMSQYISLKWNVSI